MLKKLVMGVLKLVVKFLKYLGVALNEIMVEVTAIMVDELLDLNAMTIAELRNLAKTKGISLKGKRVKEEIIEIIQNHLDVE